MKFKHTRFQAAMEITAFLLIIGMVIFVCIQWNQLPNRIPGHYNVLGEVDRWGSKSEIITLPIVGILLYLLLSFVSFLPKTWSLPVTITELNREKIYESTRNLLITIKVEILGIFFYLTYIIAASQSLHLAFTPIILLILIGTPIYFIRQMYQTAKKFQR